MFKQLDYTMIVVSDMQRSVEFYRDGLSVSFAQLIEHGAGG